MFLFTLNTKFILAQNVVFDERYQDGGMMVMMKVMVKVMIKVMKMLDKNLVGIIMVYGILLNNGVALNINVDYKQVIARFDELFKR